MDLNPVKGSEQAGRRPVLVIQNEIGNEVAPTVIIAPLTTKNWTQSYPINVAIPKGNGGLSHDSVILLSQIRTIDKTRLGKKLGNLPSVYLSKVDHAIHVSLGLQCGKIM